MKIDWDYTSRRMVVVVTAALVFGLMAAVLASPWLMSFAVGRSDRWSELSDVGQAYGGVSAFLSGLAFCGIAGSLVLQWRQVRQGQILAARERHFELAKLAVEDPTLTFPAAPELSTDELRRWLIFNLWVAHWAMLWDMAALSRPLLRRQFDALFTETSGLSWWEQRGRQGWQGEAGRRRRAFLDVAEAAYSDAIRATIATKGHDASLTGASAMDDTVREPI